jgi:TonB family protein
VVRAPDELLASELVHLVRPDGEMMNRFYPERAREREVEGYGEVLCRVDAAGGLSECRLIEEAPQGTGFGTASLRLVRLLRIGPQTTAGESTTGRTVRHRIYWLLPD